jgi:hypothetical protein
MNDWQGGYAHAGWRICDSCVGTGIVDYAECGVCDGKGKYAVGCGSNEGRMDQRYGLAECLACGRMVPREELTRVG